MRYQPLSPSPLSPLGGRAPGAVAANAFGVVAVGSGTDPTDPVWLAKQRFASLKKRLVGEGTI
jgi:hypothetical protein